MYMYMARVSYMWRASRRTAEPCNMMNVLSQYHAGKCEIPQLVVLSKFKFYVFRKTLRLCSDAGMVSAGNRFISLQVSNK